MGFLSKWHKGKVWKQNKRIMKSAQAFCNVHFYYFLIGISKSEGSFSCISCTIRRDDSSAELCIVTITCLQSDSYKWVGVHGSACVCKASTGLFFQVCRENCERPVMWWSGLSSATTSPKAQLPHGKGTANRNDSLIGGWERSSNYVATREVRWPWRLKADEPSSLSIGKLK